MHAFETGYPPVMSDVEQTLSFFASCAKSLESLLEEELRACGAQDIRQTVAGVYFSGTLFTAYRALMYLRVANRIVLILQERLVTDADSLYDAANSVAIFSSRHFIGLDQLTAETMGEGFAVCRDYFYRIAELQKGYQYCSINWNYMPPAGGGKGPTRAMRRPSSFMRLSAA